MITDDLYPITMATGGCRWGIISIYVQLSDGFMDIHMKG